VETVVAEHDSYVIVEKQSAAGSLVQGSLPARAPVPVTG
jgi:hypothetical protein